MTDTEKILEAVSQGPLPLHVLRRRTGLNHGLEVALRPLVTTGRVVRHGEMVALPVPSYADPIKGLEEDDDPTEVYIGNEDDQPTDEFGAVEGPTVPMEPTEEMPDPVIVGGPLDTDEPPPRESGVEYRGDFGSPPPDDPDATRVMEPIAPEEPTDEIEEIQQTYLVATEWTEVSAYAAEGAASHVLDEHPEGSQVLVMLAEEGIVFERALVVRRLP